MPQETRKDQDAPSLFVDGFELQLNAAGFLLPLKLGAEPVLTLRLSLVTAKTLLKSLEHVFEVLEGEIGTVQDTPQMNELLKTVSEKLIAAKKGRVTLEDDDEK